MHVPICDIQPIIIVFIKLKIKTKKEQIGLQAKTGIKYPICHVGLPLNIKR